MESAGAGFVCRATSADAPPAEIARIAELAEIWALVKFGHPWLTDDAPEWDAALLAAIPRARQAEDDAAFVAVVASMLATLCDPRTRVLSPDELSDWPQPIPARVQDGAVVVTIAGLPAFDPTARSSIAESIRGADRIVFDLRGVGASMSAWLDEIFTTLGPLLFTEDARLPATRYRVFHGYPPRVGSTSGGYYEAFETSARSSIVAGRTGRPPRVAFVLGSSQVLPAIAWPLHEEGRGFIVASEALDARAMVPSVAMPLRDRYFETRVADVAIDGRIPRLVADAITRKDPIERAVALLRSTARPRRAHLDRPVERRHAPQPAPPSELPDAAHRMLSAIHLWSVIDRFHAYPELRPRWDGALARALAAMDDASTLNLYVDVLLRLAAATDDGHSRLAGPSVSDRIGAGAAPFQARFVEGCLVVVRILAPELAGEIAVGEVISSIDGVLVTKRFTELSGLVAASTPDAHRNTTARWMLMGPLDASLQLVVDRDGEQIELSVPRWQPSPPAAPDEVYRVVEDGAIGVVDLSHLTVEQVPAMFAALASTEAIVFDMRGYPKGTAWAIAPYLDAHPGATPAAEFLQPLVARGMVGHAATRFVQPLPEEDVERYRGRTIMLVDHRTISQAEHTGLFFAAANGTRFVGSPSAGANGDVTSHVLPDGLQIWFTGQAVVPIDRPPLQRVGLQPDLPMMPTVAGVRAGEDEVMQAAIDQLVSERGAAVR